jgi:diadenosine tetraphosphatase ApaH/serine/threonine PP2A family protein phosphatase
VGQRFTSEHRDSTFTLLEDPMALHENNFHVYMQVFCHEGRTPEPMWYGTEVELIPDRQAIVDMNVVDS